ncbi:peptidylprolyl isomerase [Sediminivirga luteola]|uniref:peptidylprolyl isomerase n=1 Tax=Sediminivirga luteola TaxID=1774748 RepID=UPI001F568934|nr:peptidylprolyl isomerase [Sediminivirga luteola]MCI2266305.1 peptidylprolyl isomerase [Sediminivirga luteola]
MTRATLPVLSAALLLALTGCAGGGDETPEPAASAPAQQDAAQEPGGCGYEEAPGGVREVEMPPEEPEVAGAVDAVIATDRGEIGLTLDADGAPCTVGSFAHLAGSGYFDDTECHRLTTEGIFVLQCGDPSATGTGGPGYRFADELTGQETYDAGTLAMANAGPDTNGSQFFLVYEDAPLPPDYTVFGQIDEAGLQVLRTIAEAGTEDGGADGRPSGGVVIEGVSIG